MSITSRVLRKIISEGNKSGIDISYIRYYLYDIDDLSSFLDSPILKPGSRVSSSRPPKKELPKKYYEITIDGKLYSFNDKSFEAIDDPLYSHEIKNPTNVRKYIDTITANLGVYDEEQENKFEQLKEEYSDSLNIDFETN